MSVLGCMNEKKIRVEKCVVHDSPRSACPCIPIAETPPLLAVTNAVTKSKGTRTRLSSCSGPATASRPRCASAAQLYGYNFLTQNVLQPQVFCSSLKRTERRIDSMMNSSTNFEKHFKKRLGPRRSVLIQSRTSSLKLAELRRT